MKRARSGGQELENPNKKIKIISEFLNEKKEALFLQAKEIYDLLPALYTEFLNKIDDILLVDDEKSGTVSFDKPTPNIKAVVHNNEGYFSGYDQKDNYYQGAPIKFNDAPIGYNIHLPSGEIKGIIVDVYGGANDLQHAFKPEKNPSFLNYALEHGMAVVTLNLPDLLKLDVCQSAMPTELYIEIQACINKFFTILSSTPEKIHEILKDFQLEGKRIILYGGSFGGGLVVRHAQLYPGTFNGYITHNGVFFQFKNNFLNIQRNDINKICDSILILANKDDSCVPMKESLELYEEMKKNNPNIQLCITAIGNPTPSAGTFFGRPIYKGHFSPTDKKYFIRYCETILNFIKNGPSVLSSMSELAWYHHTMVAYKYRINEFVDKISPYVLEKAFIAEVLDFSKEKIIDKNFEKSWEDVYKPLYLAMDFCKQFKGYSFLNLFDSYYYSCISTEDEIIQNIQRLDNSLFVSNENIEKLFQCQSSLFAAFIRDFFHTKGVQISVDANAIKEMMLGDYFVGFFKSQWIASVKGATSILSRNYYFISSLYKAFPSFIPSSYVGASVDEMKLKLSEILDKKQKMILTAWQQVKDKVLKLPEVREKLLFNSVCSSVKKRSDY